MTLPDTCGAAGGAISFWMKLFSCDGTGSILSTVDGGGYSGTTFYCLGRSIG